MAATVKGSTGDTRTNPFARLRTLARGVRKQSKASCHGTADGGPSGLPVIAIVGNPNVGKSVTFNRLTGIYAAVSNYPGTTVAVSRGKGRCGGREYEIVDTPGMYSLLPITEEERVARDILIAEKPVAVLHAVDAKNLERMLPFTLQLIEAGLPVVLNLNMMDEAERLGMQIDVARLATMLGVPVVPTVATTGRGFEELRRLLNERAAPVYRACCG